MEPAPPPPPPAPSAGEIPISAAVEYPPPPPPPSGYAATEVAGAAYPQAQYGQQPHTPEVCTSCGNVFMEDAHFCRNCGAPRQGSAGKVAEAPPLMEAEGGSARLLQGGGLYLQALVFFGSRWFRLHILVLLVTLVIKILWFQYPQGWVEGELALLLCYWAVQRMQNSAGCFGNRAESSSSIGCFLALSAVLVLIVGYFSALQVYVLQIEFALGLLSLALLIGQLLLASIAGLVFSSRAHDTVLVLLGGSAAVAAVVVALVFDFGEKWSKEQLQSALSVGLFLGVGSMALAATAGAMVVVSDI